MAFRELARVHDISVREQHKMVEHRDNVATGLVDGEHHSAVVIAGKGSEGFYNIVRVVRVQTTRRFIKE